MVDLSQDVPLLGQDQFTALHMSISMSGAPYAISEEADLHSMLAAGWQVIAKGYVIVNPGLHYMYLRPPAETEEEE